MRRPFLVIAALLLVPGAAAGQVYRDLGEIELEYRIHLVEDPEPVPVGTASVAFRPTETKRGPRLSVESTIEYTIAGDPPLEYFEQASLVCDEVGPVTFETVARALGSERKNTALRRDDDYHLTITFDGTTRQTTITAGVTRTNFGLFCAGYLARPIHEGSLMEDFPLLFPVGGDHQPRQRFREAGFPLRVGKERSVPSIVNALRRLDEKTDRIWNANDERAILLRMDENRSFGLLRYELLSVNGVPVDDTELLP